MGKEMENTMDMRQLEYFLTLCEQEHMSSTAACLGISQPALSKSIASLEKEVGVQLFDRHGNYIRLNDYGRNFSEYARKALNELRMGLVQVQQTRYDTCGEVRILCHAFADCIMDCVLAYTDLNPRIKVSIRQSDYPGGNLSESTDFLLSTQNEAFMVSEDKQIWTPSLLFSEEHKILISPRYRKYPEDVTSLDIRDLKEDRFVVMPDIYVFYSDITYMLCQLSGFAPKIFCQTEDFLSKIRFTDAGKAICILPECNLRIARQLSPDLQTFSIQGFQTSRTLYLMRRQKSLMSEAALDFWEFTMDYYHAKE